MAQSLLSFTLPLRPFPTTCLRLFSPSCRHQATEHGRKALKGTPLRGMPKKSRNTGDRQKLFAKRTQFPPAPRATSPLVPLGTSTAQEQTPTEVYFVRRTPTRHLPIYQLTKAGGNLRQTRVRKTEGKVEELRGLLEKELVPRPEWVRVNPLTMHVEMKVRGLSLERDKDTNRTNSWCVGLV